MDWAAFRPALLPTFRAAMNEQAVYFTPPLIRPLARRGAERALASAFRRN
jgi:hypothetical protein